MKDAGAPLDILVVDDDERSLESVCAAVASLGHEPRAASSGQQAWELHLQRHADLVLSDWAMPGMNGAELCRRVRSTDGDRYTYFVFMTALDDRAHYLEGMEAGADDYLTKPIDYDQLAARIHAAARVVSLYRRMVARNRALRRDSNMQFQVARVDALTQLGNRLKLEEDLAVIEAQASRYPRRWCAAMCDLDRFKAYNDAFGHVAGDAALRAVADVLRSELRRSDQIYRFGGEELLALLPEQPLADGCAAMDRVRAALFARGILHPENVPHGVLTISVGVAELIPGQAWAEWVNRADRALYRAKAEGRNLVLGDPQSPRARPSGPASRAERSP